MLHIEDRYVRKHILDGMFGLEKEGLRVLADGTFAHTRHPFGDGDSVVRDFCENQTEINTGVHPTAAAAIGELQEHYVRMQRVVRDLPSREYIWPFSNPPLIRSENDIPIADFGGKERFKTAYRDYLSDKYGRYRMAFSGIHVNFSLSEELLRRSFRLHGGTSFQEYKNKLYLKLAGSLAVYGWILTAATAASPLLDRSFVEKGVCGGDVFMGLASVRCSELGYWNDFVPVLDYQSLDAYAASIEEYVHQGLLKAPSELYYPIRLKPAGENSLESLRENGVNHIELRMFDLNPLCEEGLEVRDVLFAQLLMIWLLARPEESLSARHQVHAVQNFKNAAHYDLKTVKIALPDGRICSVAQAAMNIIDEMKCFFGELQLDVRDILDFQYEKFQDAECRYAWRVRKQFQGGFVKKGMELARQRQEACAVAGQRVSCPEGGKGDGCHGKGNRDKVFAFGGRRGAWRPLWRNQLSHLSDGHLCPSGGGQDHGI